MSKSVTEEELASIFGGLADINIEIPPDPLQELETALGLREVTTDELALIFGITDRRISQLWQAGIIPEPRREHKRYYFPLLQSVAGYLEYLREL